VNSKRITRWIIYLVIGVAIAAILWGYNSTGTSTEELAISNLAQQIKDDEVAELGVAGDGREVTVIYRDQNRSDALAMISNTSSLEEILATYGISERIFSEGNTVIIYEAPSQWGGLLNLLGIFLPALLIIGFIYFILRQAQGSNNQALSFGKSKARVLTGESLSVSAPASQRAFCWSVLQVPGRR